MNKEKPSKIRIMIFVIVVICAILLTIFLATRLSHDGTLNIIFGGLIVIVWIGVAVFYEPILYWFPAKKTTVKDDINSECYYKCPNCGRRFKGPGFCSYCIDQTLIIENK